MATDRGPRHLVVMGVSGSGKTTLAAELVRRLGVPFCEGDDLHSPENRQKMSAGRPLDDADREPWLRAIRDWMDQRARRGQATVVTCSALKRRYRDVLSQAQGDVWFVHVDPPADTTRARMDARKGHFMPAALLDSQLAALEPLGDDEQGVRITSEGTPGELATEVLSLLQGRCTAGGSGLLGRR